MLKEGIIRIYGTGGAAANILSSVYGVQKTPGFAELKTCFVDTSLSNVRDKVGSTIKEEDIYLLEDVDGSGKIRKTHYQSIVKSAKEIIHKFKPEDLNIVVSSASGGSGSVISMTLVKELKEAGHTVILILVGSEESHITIDNTVKTLQTLDNISRNQLRQPVLVSYWHNSVDHSRKDNDISIRQTISALSILGSKQNKELDTTDVANFINVEKATSVQEGIVFLYITSKEEEAKKIEYPISLASLFSKEGEVAHALTPEYSCNGYPPAEVLKESDLHFITSQYDVANTFKRLTKRLDEFKASSSARRESVALGGNADDNGMVF